MNKLTIDDRKILLIMLGLIVLLFAHNIYLQTRVNKAIGYASNAEYEARRAKNYAADASENAFGNVCRYCP